MENYASIGTYSISSDGSTINYSAPSFLPKEMVEKIVADEAQINRDGNLSIGLNLVVDTLQPALQTV
ncbi:MAG TPA: hypothetical protein VGM30_21025 [Puia sp.]|jgi:hypothetical protein